MKPNPKSFEQALAEEKQNRELAYLHIAAPLLGCQVVTLTWRHVVELTLAENAFFTGGEPSRADVYQLLWRLNPCFRRPDGSMSNLDRSARAEGAARPTWLTCFFQQWRVNKLARSCKPHLAEPIIRDRLNAAFQDVPSTSDKSGDDYVSSLRAAITWFDYVTSEFALAGHSKDACLGYGVAWTFQVLRIRDIKSGREDDYIAPSAALKRFAN